MRRRFWKLAKRLLFRLDAETAHTRAIRALRFWLRFGDAPLRWISGAQELSPGSQLPRVLGLEFRSRIGLAAGFDKNGEVLRALPALGFGFAEIGTVTPRPQPGNERPRLFRDLPGNSLFNRMGFNNSGAEAVARRLEVARGALPTGFRVGVNVGKNKDTPLEDAARDYVRAAAPFKGLADFIVINVSSPNTPGLRSLQNVESLRAITSEVGQLIAGWNPRPPLLLKLAPEIRGDALADIIRAGEGDWGVDGWVLTNTLGGNWPAGDQHGLNGGWSGGVLTEVARASLAEAKGVARKPLISVGGIMSPEEAAVRLSIGADLVEVYTGWIFNGPSFPAEITAKVKSYPTAV